MKFGTDGIRGAAHVDLTTDVAARLGRAAVRVLGAHPVVVGGDTRESTPSLETALAAGFRAEGAAVTSLGVAPTPFVAFVSERRKAIGAVVSASHNHYADNGIKLFAPGGTKLSDEVQQRIETEFDAIEATAPAAADAPLRGRVAGRDEQDYVDHVLAVLEGRRLDGLRVVLDCANGAAARIGPEVLRATGADVVVVADRPDGRNINDGCGATHPETVAAAVVDHGADAGIALDGDADRLIAVDHRGTIVDGDHVIAICAGDLRARGALRHDAVVVTVMANLGFRLAMRERGIDVVETAVGDRYVLEALAAHDLSLGGEQSGHVVFADHATTGDGLLTAVALLDALVRDGRPLADVAAEAMTSLPQVLVNVQVSDRVPDVAERLAEEIAAWEAHLGDTGRVLVRASGTEPLIRVMVEAPTEEAARQSADGLAAVVRERFG